MARISVKQSVLPFLSPDIPCFQYTRQSSSMAIKHLTSDNPNILGMAMSESAHGSIEHLALATLEVVIIISKDLDARQQIDSFFEDILDGQSGIYLAAFRMAKLAVHLFCDWGLPRIRGVDLSTLCSKSTMCPLQPSILIGNKLHSDIDKHTVDKMFAAYKDVHNLRSLCHRAWLSAHVANRCASEIVAAPKVDTSFLKKDILECLSILIVQADELERLKSQKVTNEFELSCIKKDGDLDVRNARYSTRVRDKASVLITSSDGKAYVGRAVRVKGKTTTIELEKGYFSGALRSIVAFGRQEPTNSERARSEFVLLVLRGEQDLSSPFIRILWFPTPQDVRQLRVQSPPMPPSIATAELNLSQRAVVSAMVSILPAVVVVQGPPGTGKTSTISAAAKIWEESHSHTWIVANSNVAVKNIAESMFKKGVRNFIILVSKEFFIEWHEHIYKYIKERLLCSDDFPDNIHGLKRLMGGSCIVLSTLSMLSNLVLKQIGAFRLVPVERLVIDEASQINVFNLMPLFARFRQLKKVCFFGDPKQLPPHGQDVVASLQCVFDIPHLRYAAYFLDTQYRMPIPIGDYISREVYGGRLRSEHGIKSMSCLSIIDVSQGEEVSGGRSWMNLAEVQIIVSLVRHYYRGQDFCIITPYDQQRAEIEKQLKAENLPWESVFTVDSFQGNEAQFVLVSVVRTSKPGFLASLNRINVMLTRCKTGMVIVTNRAFLHTHGKDTLLGRLSRYWQTEFGAARTWVDSRAVVEGNVILPGPSFDAWTTRLAALRVEDFPALEPPVKLVDNKMRGHQQARDIRPWSFARNASTSEQRHHPMVPWAVAIRPAITAPPDEVHHDSLTSDAFPPLPVHDPLERSYRPKNGLAPAMGAMWSNIVKSQPESLKPAGIVQTSLLDESSTRNGHSATARVFRGGWSLKVMKSTQRRGKVTFTLQSQLC